MASTSPEKPAINRSRRRWGRIGRLRHFRGIDDADVARLQLAGDAGFLRALHQAS